jgi:hypothetical protein
VLAPLLPISKAKPNPTKQRKEVNTMIGIATESSRDFQSHKSPFEVLCKAEDIGLESYVRCLEENPQFCQFSVPFGYAHFCDSPVRVHLCKKLGR